MSPNNPLEIYCPNSILIQTNILSLQFKKFTQNRHLDCDMAFEDDRDIIIKK